MGTSKQRTSYFFYPPVVIDVMQDERRSARDSSGAGQSCDRPPNRSLRDSNAFRWQIAYILGGLQPPHLRHASTQPAIGRDNFAGHSPKLIIGTAKPFAARRRLARCANGDTHAARAALEKFPSLTRFFQDAATPRDWVRPTLKKVLQARHQVSTALRLRPKAAAPPSRGATDHGAHPAGAPS